MRRINKTRYYSKKIGTLPKGCKMCVKGEKLVLYITGICPRACWFCPLSEKRKDLDVIYANEAKIGSIQEVITEAKLCSSKGCGITGGDPLSKLERTIEYIKALKHEFGKKFHIHLYTTFVLANRENLKKLYDSGLDEIRFHPDFNKKSDWNKIDNALIFDWDVGLEIPCIPNEKDKIIEMIDFFKDKKVKFLNINEFEVAERNFDGMEKENYITKTDISHGVLGSDEVGQEILEYCRDLKLNVHYCPSKLKDKVQMQNRFKLRAKKVSTKYDIITDEGMLVRGVIYLKELVPGLEYKEKLKHIDKKEFLIKLERMKNFLEEENLDLIVDKKKLRLITYPEHVEQFKKTLKNLNLIPAIIEEDPSVESFETYINFL